MGSKSFTDSLNSGIACDYPRVTDDETIIAGVSGKCLQAMGRDGDGKWKPSLTTAADGSEVIAGFAANDFDTTSEGTNADTPCPIYKTGRFVEEEVDFNDHTVDTVLFDQLRSLNLFFAKYGGGQ